MTSRPPFSRHDRGPAMPALLLALTAAAGLALLSAAVSSGRLAAADHGLLVLFATLRGPVADSFFQAVTWLGSGYLLLPATLLLLAWLLARRQRGAAWRLGLTYFGASLSSWMLKASIGRERPTLHPALTDFVRMDWSFPSGHTTHAAAFALGLWLALRQSRGGAHLPLALLLGGLVLLVAASRLHLQVHWPSDVLAGLLLALGWAGLAVATLRKGPTNGSTP